MVTIANFRESQYPEVEGTRCIKIFIPDDDTFLQLLAGLVALANSESNYVQDDIEKAAALAQQWRDAYLQSDWAGCGGDMWAPGDVKMYAGLDYPLPGWLLCDGASLLRTDYPDLFDALGTQWGAVDGTHFNIPDYRGRSPMGEGRLDGDMGNPLWQMGNKTGDAEVTLTEAQMPSHSHTSYAPALYATAQAGAGTAGIGGAISNPAIVTGDAGGDDPHPNYHPVQVIRFFIYAGV